MPKITYEIECDNPPNGFMVYKVDSENTEAKMGYAVTLDHYAKDAHDCRCPHGEFNKYEEGKVRATCKHIKLVLEQRSL